MHYCLKRLNIVCRAQLWGQPLSEQRRVPGRGQELPIIRPLSIIRVRVCGSLRWATVSAVPALLWRRRPVLLHRLCSPRFRRLQEPLQPAWVPRSGDTKRRCGPSFRPVLERRPARSATEWVRLARSPIAADGSFHRVDVDWPNQHRYAVVICFQGDGQHLRSHAEKELAGR